MPHLLGKFGTEEQVGERDAIHMSFVIARVADGEVYPGMFVAFTGPDYKEIVRANRKVCHGIVDPWLVKTQEHEATVAEDKDEDYDYSLMGRYVAVLLRPGLVSHVRHQFEIDNEVNENPAEGEAGFVRPGDPCGGCWPNQ